MVSTKRFGSSTVKARVAVRARRSHHEVGRLAGLEFGLSAWVTVVEAPAVTTTRACELRAGVREGNGGRPNCGPVGRCNDEVNMESGAPVAVRAMEQW